MNLENIRNFVIIAHIDPAFAAHFAKATRVKKAMAGKHGKF